MKRIFNKSIFLIFLGLFIIFNILFMYFINKSNSSFEKELLSDSIIMNMYSNKAIVKNAKLPMNNNDASIKPYINSDNKIMVPLEFMLKSFGCKYEYNTDTSEMKIINNTKELQWNGQTNIRIIINEGNTKYEYSYDLAEKIDSTVYFPLHVLAEFFDKTFIVDGALVILDGKDNTREIQEYINKNTDLLDRLKEKFIDNTNTDINISAVNIERDLGAYNWIKSSRVVAHALGGINKANYTNSYDAFMENYNKGFRVFEVDLVMTRDGHLVARHDWHLDRLRAFKQSIPFNFAALKTLGFSSTTDGLKLDMALSREEFKNRLIYEKYKPLDFVDIVKLMEKYPDVYIITDTKGTTKEEIEPTFKYIVSQTKNVNPEILNRIIPQIYNEDMLKIIKDIHDFKSPIYTMYQLENVVEEDVVKFAKENNIKVIVMGKKSCTTCFMSSINKDDDIYVFVHTVNTAQEINEHGNNGVYGFFTDSITPTQLSN